MHRCRGSERSCGERTCPIFLSSFLYFGKLQPLHQSTQAESRVHQFTGIYVDSTVIQPAFDKWLWFSHRQAQKFSGIPLFCVVALFMHFCSPVDFIYPHHFSYVLNITQNPKQTNQISLWSPGDVSHTAAFFMQHHGVVNSILCGLKQSRGASSSGSWSVLQHLAMFLSSPKEQSGSESKGQRCQSAKTPKSLAHNP